MLPEATYTRLMCGESGAVILTIRFQKKDFKTAAHLVEYVGNEMRSRSSIYPRTFKKNGHTYRQRCETESIGRNYAAYKIYYA